MPTTLSSTNRRVVGLLEVMWDWRSMTSNFGYEERAPEYYRINPKNLTGSRLYGFLGKQGQYYDELLVTNACPQLVRSAKEKGTPDPEWLSTNLKNLQPFTLLLVCGRVAQNTYRMADAGKARIVELPHPAARMWTAKSLAFARRIIQEGTRDLTLEFRGGKLVASMLVPF